MSKLKHLNLDIYLKFDIGNLKLIQRYQVNQT